MRPFAPGWACMEQAKLLRRDRGTHFDTMRRRNVSQRRLRCPLTRHADHDIVGSTDPGGASYRGGQGPGTS